MREVSIKAHKDQTTALCLDTISLDKQALVFCSSKRAAESQAEKVAVARKETKAEWEDLANRALKALATPTKQCKRLALCLKHGVAFHHAGLNSKQRELIEDNFRAGLIAVICSTPTLAAGLDMPAFRAIIRDNKRFGNRGMMPIPVLEYEQMSGRAGRPGKEDYGEAILVASKNMDVVDLEERYINGEVEDIYSKLAVEPVLRTYILSLVSSELIKDRDSLYSFFDSTFYAYQFGDSGKLHATLDRMVTLLRKWRFLEGEAKEETKESQGFFSAASLLKKDGGDEGNENLVATALGKRVSEIYLDPLTAHMLLFSMERLSRNTSDVKSVDQTFSVIHLLCSVLELRPLLRVKAIEMEEILSAKEQYRTLLSEDEFYDFSQDDFDDTIKTTIFLMDWINEVQEDKLLDKYGIRPGEVSIKLQLCEWLLFGCTELARIEQMQPILKIIRHIQLRLKHGVKSELIPLLKFKGVGRVRARKLYSNGVTDVGKVKSTSIEVLSGILGPTMAAKVKEQAGEDVSENPDKKKLFDWS